MAKSWQEVFNTGNGAHPDPVAEPEAERHGFFRRLRENLSKSREALTGELRATFVASLDEATWEQLEEALIYADVGARTTAKVVEQLERESTEDGVAGPALVERLAAILAET